jgi:3-oxoacyl-[acyl-carrier-protein] synthase-1
MAGSSVAILQAGLVSSVGLTLPTAGAAFRAGISNPTRTRFMMDGGAYLMAHQVPLARQSLGLQRLAEMAAMAIDECLADVPAAQSQGIPMLLCVAEQERAGRLEGLDDRLFACIQQLTGRTFDKTGSASAAVGRPGGLMALTHARRLIAAGAPHVLIVAADSLLHTPTLLDLQQRDRLLAARQANGFLPGEAAAAVLIGPDQGARGTLRCVGVGVANEPSHLNSDEPLRADGLAHAIRGALADAGCELHHIDFRVTDLSGEHYFFKEAALALSRILRQRKPEFDLWHPAEYVGEVGAAIGPIMMAHALHACRKGYAPGGNVLLHASADSTRRAAAVLQYAGNA